MGRREPALQSEQYSRRFQDSLGRSVLEGEESALRELVRSSLELLEKQMVFIDFN